AHWASTTTTCPFLPANLKYSTSLPAVSPSTTSGGAGSAWAASKVVLSSFSANCGSWPTAKRNGLESPSSVWTRTGYTPSATSGKTVSLKVHARALLRLGSTGSIRNANGPISRGFPPRFEPPIVTSLETPRWTPNGRIPTIYGVPACAKLPQNRAIPQARTTVSVFRVMGRSPAPIRASAIDRAGAILPAQEHLADSCQARSNVLGGSEAWVVQDFFNPGSTSHSPVFLSSRRRWNA